MLAPESVYCPKVNEDIEKLTQKYVGHLIYNCIYVGHLVYNCLPTQMS